MAEQYVLSLDVGTHAVKAAIVCTGDWTIKYLVEEPLTLVRLDASRVEQDAEQIVSALGRCITQVLTQSPYVPEYACLACQRSTVVAWDVQTLEPLGPALSWQDTRGKPYLAGLPSNPKLQQLSGLTASPHYGASKLHWLQTHYHLCPQKHRMGPLISYIIHCLMDSPIPQCDESNAARTQLLDIRQGQWSADLLEHFAVDVQLLPVVRPAIHQYGRLKSSGIPLKAACGDQNAALLSSIAPNDHSKIVVNIGTGAFALRPVNAAPATKPLEKNNKLLQSLIINNAHQRYFAQEGTVNGAGSALSHLCQQGPFKQLGGEDFLFKHLDSWLLEGMDQACLYINTIGGLGSPFWQAGPSPVFKALSAANTTLSPKDQAIAVVESVVFLLSINVSLLDSPSPAPEILISGGLARLDGLCQRFADLLDRPLTRLTQHEATLIGAAKAPDYGLNRIETLHRSLDGQPFIPQPNPGIRERFAIFEREIGKALD